jgi:hypothetical protein
MKVIIDRLNEGDKQTESLLTILNEKEETIFNCYTLELPWNDNKKQISCIPKGEYNVEKRQSTKYKNHFHVLDVPNRSYILIHQGNYNWHTKGCILVGKTLTDINNDGLRDVTGSVATMNKLNDILPNYFKLQIR